MHVKWTNEQLFSTIHIKKEKQKVFHSFFLVENLPFIFDSFKLLKIPCKKKISLSLNGLLLPHPHHHQVPYNPFHHLKYHSHSQFPVPVSFPHWKKTFDGHVPPIIRRPSNITPVLSSFPNMRYTLHNLKRLVLQLARPLLCFSWLHLNTSHASCQQIAMVTQLSIRVLVKNESKLSSTSS